MWHLCGICVAFVWQLCGICVASVGRSFLHEYATFFTLGIAGTSPKRYHVATFLNSFCEQKRYVKVFVFMAFVLLFMMACRMAQPLIHSRLCSPNTVFHFRNVLNNSSGKYQVWEHCGDIFEFVQPFWCFFFGAGLFVKNKRLSRGRAGSVRRQVRSETQVRLK